MLLYAFAIAFALTYFHFWQWIYLKDIIIWVLFAGVPECFNAVSETIDKNYFRNMITDNLKFATLVEFFTGTFTFNIMVEFILQPVVVFFILMQTIADAKEEFKTVRRFSNWLVAILGFTILGFTIKNAIESYDNINEANAIVSFCLPIVFSLLYLPFAYGFAVYAKYEMLFIRMSFKEPQDKTIQRNRHWKVIRLCKFSYSKVCRFENEYIKNMYATMSAVEFNNIIKRFKDSYRRKEYC